MIPDPDVGETISRHFLRSRALEAKRRYEYLWPHLAFGVSKLRRGRWHVIRVR